MISSHHIWGSFVLIEHDSAIHIMGQQIDILLISIYTFSENTVANIRYHDNAISSPPNTNFIELIKSVDNKSHNKTHL